MRDFEDLERILIWRDLVRDFDDLDRILIWRGFGTGFQ